MAKAKAPIVVGVTVPATPEEVVAVHNAMREKFVGKLSSLTRRENQVMLMMAYGRSNRSIAEELGISPKTLDIHRANVQRKFGAKGGFVLVAYFVAMGYLSDGAGSPSKLGV